MYKKLSNVIELQQKKTQDTKSVKTTIWQQQAIYFANKLQLDISKMDISERVMYFKLFKSAFNSYNEGIVQKVYSYLYDNNSFYSYSLSHRVKLIIKMYYLYLSRIRGNKKS